MRRLQIFVNTATKREFGLYVGLISAAAICVAVIFMASAREGDIILELKDVQFFQAQQTSSGPISIRLSGLAFHSSLAVREITTEQHDRTLQLFAHLMLATPGTSGDFDYSLIIPRSVTRVEFGNEKIVIWNRDTGLVQSE